MSKAYKNKLNIPSRDCGPDDKADFSSLDIPAAGSVERPDIKAEPKDMIDYAFSLVRVMDDDNNAVGPWNPELSTKDLKTALSNMVLTKLYDDRMQNMQRVGKMSFYMRSRGEEAIAIGQAMALDDNDMLFPSYRQQGMLIARGKSIVDMMCQCLSNSHDNCKGRQLPIMYSWPDVGFFSISGNLGTQFPQAVGYAMACAYKGENKIASTWVGDGTTAEGDFHYGMTFASVYQAPVILNVVNNQWAISSNEIVAGAENATFAARGIGYGVPSIRVDGNDFLAVYAVTKWAAERARSGGGPTLIELYTYRAAPHSTSDDPSKYRPADEFEQWPLGDPIERLKQHLINLGDWSEEQHEELTDKLGKKVTKAYKEAESYGTLNSGERPSVASMFEDVYKNQPEHLRKQRQQLGI